MTLYRIRIYRPTTNEQVHARTFNARNDTEATAGADGVYRHWRARNRQPAVGTEWSLFRLNSQTIRWDRVTS